MKPFFAVKDNSDGGSRSRIGKRVVTVVMLTEEFIPKRLDMRNKLLVGVVTRVRGLSKNSRRYHQTLIDANNLIGFINRYGLGAAVLEGYISTTKLSELVRAFYAKTGQDLNDSLGNLPTGTINQKEQ